MKKYGNIALQLVENLPRLENSVRFLESFVNLESSPEKDDSKAPEEQQGFAENEHDAIQKMCFSNKSEPKKLIGSAKKRIKCIRCALSQLSETERTVVEIKLQTENVDDFLFEVYRKVGIERSSAYRTLSEAKEKLATALFGEINGARRR